MEDENTDAKKQVMQQQCMLFDELITQEIIPRLPIKSLLRFGSVSKQWYSTLSSHSFAISHLNRSPFSHPSAPVQTLFITCGDFATKNKFYLFLYDTDQHTSGDFASNLVDSDNEFEGEPFSGDFASNIVKLHLEFDLGDDKFYFSGSCNGLICLSPVSSLSFILWNPTTRKYHKHGYDEAFENVSYSSFVACGFGYVHSIDDYKYVRISMSSCTATMIVHIFSLKGNKWRKINFDVGIINVFGQIYEPVLANETLYWTPIAMKRKRVIIIFDLELEKVEIIDASLSYLDNTGVLGGCFCMYNFDVKASGEKLMGILKSPAQVKSFSLREELISDCESEMIGFTRTGKFFFKRSDSDEDPYELGLVNPNTEPMQYSKLVTFTESIIIARYVPSLVSPFPFPDLSADA